MKKLIAGVVVAAALGAVPVPARAEISLAVIDVQRVVTESDKGKEALAKLKKLQDGKIEEGRNLQVQLDGLKDQYSKQRFTLTEEKLEELSKQIEEGTIAMKRFQDDAQRQLDDARRRQLGALEESIMPVIDRIGKERGVTLIFNKFQSGLVFADQSVDITDEVIRQFNLSQ